MQYHESFDDLRVMVQHEGSTVARSMDVHEIVRVLTAKDAEIKRLKEKVLHCEAIILDREQVIDRLKADSEKLCAACEGMQKAVGGRDEEIGTLNEKLADQKRRIIEAIVRIGYAGEIVVRRNGAFEKLPTIVCAHAIAAIQEID